MKSIPIHEATFAQILSFIKIEMERNPPRLIPKVDPKLDRVTLVKSLKSFFKGYSVEVDDTASMPTHLVPVRNATALELVWFLEVFCNLKDPDPRAGHDQLSALVSQQYGADHIHAPDDPLRPHFHEGHIYNNRWRALRSWSHPLVDDFMANRDELVKTLGSPAGRRLIDHLDNMVTAVEEDRSRDCQADLEVFPLTQVVA